VAQRWANNGPLLADCWQINKFPIHDKIKKNSNNTTYNCYKRLEI
jgi:hypothetical protein